MEVKYYPVPEGINYGKDFILDRFDFYIEAIVKEKDKIKQYQGSSFLLENTSTYVSSQIHEKGIVIDIRTQKVDQYDQFAAAKLIIADEEISYVTSDVEYYDHITGRIKIERINEETINKLIEQIGPGLEIPTSRFRWIEKRKKEEFSTKKDILFDLYMNRLTEKNIDYIKQIESEEDKRKRREQKIEHQRRQVEVKKESYERSIKKFEEVSGEEIEVKRTKLPFEALFRQVGDHYEFHPFFLQNNRLREIDLSEIDFGNIKLCGVDLSETNAIVDPQTVYNKDMSNGHFEGVNFDFKSFKDVDITNSTFGIAKTHGFEPNLDGAINHNKGTNK